MITKNNARNHENNLKKQGILALIFENPSDYDKIKENDRISIIGLEEFAPGKPLICEILHEDGNKEVINLKHSYNKFQTEWFRAGSALNVLRSKEM